MKFKDVIKRSFDIVSSAIVLIIAFPLLLVVAAWIKLDSPGPVFFLQQRVGLDCRPFRIIKFRTMVNRSPDQIDQNSELVIVAGEDPRITRAGRFLRATSIDELPQLINILMGDMSVVGPRPVLIEQKDVVPPGYMKRFTVRPGLTGLAQVQGRRSLGWLRQLFFDAEYVDKRDFGYDIGIIIKTVKVVLLSNDIYGAEEVNWRAYRDSLGGRAPQDKDVEEVIK